MARLLFFGIVVVICAFSAQTKTRKQDITNIAPSSKFERHQKARTLYDYQTRVVAYKDVIGSRCLLEFLKNGENLIRQNFQKTVKNVFLSENKLSKQQIWTIAGQRIVEFCKGFPTYLIQETQYPQTDNLLLNNLFERTKRKIRKRSTKHYFVGRMRGQTQSQYLNFGNTNHTGKAEAESTYGSSKAVVTGNSGMGQAQSQSGSSDCSECYGQGGGDQDQGLQFGRIPGGQAYPEPYQQPGVLTDQRISQGPRGPDQSTYYQPGIQAPGTADAIGGGKYDGSSAQRPLGPGYPGLDRPGQLPNGYMKPQTTGYLQPSADLRPGTDYQTPQIPSDVQLIPGYTPGATFLPTDKLSPGYVGIQKPSKQIVGYPPGYTTQQVPGYDGQRVPGYTQQQIPGYTGQQIPGYTGQQTPGSTQQQIPGYTGHQIPGYTGQQIPGSTQQQIPGYTEQKIPGSTHQLPGYTGQQIPGSSQQQIPGSTQQQIPGSTQQQIPGSAQQQIPGYTGQQIPGYAGRQVPSSVHPQIPGYAGQSIPGYEGQQVPGYAGQQISGYIDQQQIQQRPTYSTDQALLRPTNVGDYEITSGLQTGQQLISTQRKPVGPYGKFSGQIAGNYDSRVGQRGKFAGTFSGDYSVDQNGRLLGELPGQVEGIPSSVHTTGISSQKLPLQIAETPGRVSSLPGQIGTVPGQVGGLPGQVGGLPGQVGGLPGQVGGLPGQIGTVPGQVGGLPGQVGGLPGQVGGLPGQVGGLPGQVGGLPSQVGGLPGQVGRIPGQVGGLPGQVGGLPGQVGGLPGQVGGLPGQVGGLPGQVGGLPGQVGGIPGQVEGILGQVGGLPGQVGGLPGQVGGIPGQLGGLPGQVGGIPGQVGGIPGQVGVLPGQIGGLPGQVGGLPGQVGGLPGHVGGLPGQVGGLPGQVGGLPGQIGGLPGQVGGIPGQVGGIPGQVGGLPGQVGGIPGQVGGLPGQVGGLPGQVGGLPGQVGGLPGQVGGLPGQLIGAPGQVIGAPGQVVGVPGQITGAPGQVTAYDRYIESLGGNQTLLGPITNGQIDDSDSQVQTSVQQTNNETQASASAQGKYLGGTAQSQVSGTYAGSGSFSASAGSDDGKRGALTQVSGGKEGATSSAQGRGGLGQSQAQVQVDSDTGETISNSQTGGWNHGTQTQVQASGKGGMADSQANGPGSTSSQAQIGFLPFDENDPGNDQETPFKGGGMASAQSGTYSGQTQSQIQGKFRYGIRYMGAAQAGSGSKDTIQSARNQSRPFGLSGNFPGFKPLTYSSGSSSGPQKSQAHKAFSAPSNIKMPDKDDLEKQESEVEENLTIKPTNDQDYGDYENENEEDYDSMEEPEKPKTKNIISQKSKNQRQHIILDPLEDLDATVRQSNGDFPNEGTILQPGQRIPGSPGYQIPQGFRGRVKSVAQGPNTYTTGHNSQAQSVTLTPGTGRIIYKRPVYAVSSNTHYRNGKIGFGSGYTYQPVQHQLKSGGTSLPNFVSVTKSETGSRNPYTGKKTPSIYYTQSSSCGVFTNTCVFNGSGKVCLPKPKTNPDGTLMVC